MGSVGQHIVCRPSRGGRHPSSCAAAAAHHDVTLALELQGSLKVGMLICYSATIGCLICDQTGACSPQDASAHGRCVLGSQLRHEVTVLVPFMLPAGKTPRASLLAATQLAFGSGRCARKGLTRILHPSPCSWATPRLVEVSNPPVCWHQRGSRTEGRSWAPLDMACHDICCSS